MGHLAILVDVPSLDAVVVIEPIGTRQQASRGHDLIAGWLGIAGLVSGA